MEYEQNCLAGQTNPMEKFPQGRATNELGTEGQRSIFSAMKLVASSKIREKRNQTNKYRRECVMQNPFLNYVEKKRWVGHKGKTPKNPKTGRSALVSDPQTWGTYEEVQDGKKKYSFDGIGIVLGKLPGEELMLAGIDMDHVIRTDGTLEPFAQEIVSEMNSYTEISPSGGGLHILCLVKCSEVGRKKGMGNGCKLEMYNHGRYFTVTENSYGEEGSKPISERTEEFLRVHDKYFGVKQKEASEVREELRREKNQMMNHNLTLRRVQG